MYLLFSRQIFSPQNGELKFPIFSFLHYVSQKYQWSFFLIVNISDIFVSIKFLTCYSHVHFMVFPSFFCTNKSIIVKVFFSSVSKFRSILKLIGEFILYNLFSARFVAANWFFLIPITLFCFQKSSFINYTPLYNAVVFSISYQKIKLSKSLNVCICVNLTFPITFSHVGIFLLLITFHSLFLQFILSRGSCSLLSESDIDTVSYLDMIILVGSPIHLE